MEVLYGKMNDVSFMVSAVVKYRESYVGPYVLRGDEEEFGRTSPIEQEIKENPDVCGYVIRSKAWQLDDKAELSPIYVDHYVMIGTREVDPLSSKNAGVVRLENGINFNISSSNCCGKSSATRLTCCKNRNDLLVNYLKFRYSVTGYLCDDKHSECAKHFVKKD